MSAQSAASVSAPGALALLSTAERESEAKGATRGGFEERSNRMGWATGIVSGEGFVTAVTGRLERIKAEAAHTGAGRGDEERSPPKKKGARPPCQGQGGRNGERAATVAPKVPEMTGSECESDEEMRVSDLDKSVREETTAARTRSTSTAGTRTTTGRRDECRNRRSAAGDDGRRDAWAG
jgi:hypothetical protein